MMPSTKTLLKLTVALTALTTLSACETTPTEGVDPVDAVCSEYCAGARPDQPGAFQLVKQLFTDGRFVEVPMRNIYLLDEDGTLVTPYDASYANAPVDGSLPLPDKTSGLEPSCFAQGQYRTPRLGDIDLTHDNTTITFLNVDRDGRIESRDFDPTDTSYAEIDRILSSRPSATRGSEYRAIQMALSSRKRPNSDDLYQRKRGEPVPRNLQGAKVPGEKTPFYTDLTQSRTYSDKRGHVFFYVLVDSDLSFARNVAALVPYAPQSNAVLKALYAPFVQYPVFPAQTGSDRLDVLTFHFIRDPGLQPRGGSGAECRYVYDMHVIAEGQEPYPSVTPLFIDPEVKTRGIILP